MSDNIANANIDSDTIELLTTAFKLYEIAKLDGNVYRKDDNLRIAKNLIEQYYKRINPNYNNMIYDFKRKYVSNEALVEKNDTPEERKGLNLVYDYIQNYDIEKEKFNIFITSLMLHSLLYKPLDEKCQKEVEEAREKIKRLMEEAKRERNINKYKEAKQLSTSIEGTKFGGVLRTSPAVMQGFDYEVPSSNEAIVEFNKYISPEKTKEFEDALNSKNIFDYIDYSVNTTADLIGLQPFGDGNKRTFRSLLNLMFKEKNLPPVYITRKERKAYHEALEKAITKHEYAELDAFYYYKICDSIYELDFKKYIEQEKTSEKIR